MKNAVLILIVSVLSIAVGVYLLVTGTPQTGGQEADIQRLFPDLENRLNDISRIRVETGGQAYNVIKDATQWSLPDKGGFPVMFEQVKPLLLAIAQLEKVEPKTGKPENYARLGVQEPDTDSDNVRLELYLADNERVASLIIGSTRPGLITGGRDGIYVRVSGDNRAWLVAGNLDLPMRQVDWVDRRIIHIKPKQVKRITIIHPDGERLVIGKAYKGAAGFSVIENADAAAKKSRDEINSLARALAGLDLIDMRTRSSANPSDSETVTAVFETWDGLQVTATTRQHDRQVWAWFDLGGDVSEIPGDTRKRLEGWSYRLPASPARKLRAR